MGFSYTAAWSISFYPQFLLNLKRRCSRFLNSEDMNVAEGKHVVTRSIQFEIPNLSAVLFSPTLKWKCKLVRLAAN